MTCKHRYFKTYDDGGGHVDIQCLECDRWPDWEELDPYAISYWNLYEGDDWKAEYERNRLGMPTK